jgi:hypothetical protein
MLDGRGLDRNRLADDWRAGSFASSPGALRNNSVMAYNTDAAMIHRRRLFVRIG